MTGNGDPVRPDKQTKGVFAVMYGFAMAVMGFLALQVWLLNANVARLEERGLSRSDAISDIKMEIRDLQREIRDGLDALRVELSRTAHLHKEEK